MPSFFTSDFDHKLNQLSNYSDKDSLSVQRISSAFSGDRITKR
ncbi:hypothetical protein PSE_4353 [Pseudovibrio sp. FO-BEG1]|nr:hypothetical protein PSE_4353 [Pseudovibrio sp. FO-BEG1]